MQSMFVAHNVGLGIFIESSTWMELQRLNLLIEQCVLRDSSPSLHFEEEKNVAVLCIRIILRCDIYQSFFFVFFFAPRQIINLFNHLMCAYFFSDIASCYQKLDCCSHLTFSKGGSRSAVVVANLEIIITPLIWYPANPIFYTYFYKSFYFFTKNSHNKRNRLSQLFFSFLRLHLLHMKVMSRWAFFFLSLSRICVHEKFRVGRIFSAKTDSQIKFSK